MTRPIPTRLPVLRRPADERERVAAELSERMDGPVTALGVIFLLVVLVDTAIRPEGALAVAFDLAGWLLWAVFVLEFALRAVVAPSTGAFLRRNWWQVVFLALPFLRFVRILARVARLGRVVSSAVRTTRGATATLSSRLGWLSAATAIVVLAASQILYEFAPYERYADALHDAALATITGEPTGVDSAAADVLEVVLALYSVVVFATLAGVLGAYFLRPDRDRDQHGGQHQGDRTRQGRE
jgi:voltage-gated potassium channel